MLCFNPSVSMDYSGRINFKPLDQLCPKFQSFCINGLLWKNSAYILKAYAFEFQSFCINGLLWKYMRCSPPPKPVLMFQSFCINGLLWKIELRRRSSIHISVSILLYQWITLEVLSGSCTYVFRACFNPSVSMDYSGSRYSSAIWPHFLRFNPSVSMDYSGSQ